MRPPRRDIREQRRELNGRVDTLAKELNDRIESFAADVSKRFDDGKRELAELRERMAKLEGSLEGCLTGRRDRDSRLSRRPSTPPPNRVRQPAEPAPAVRFATSRNWSGLRCSRGPRRPSKRQPIAVLLDQAAQVDQWRRRGSPPLPKRSRGPPSAALTGGGHSAIPATWGPVPNTILSGGVTGRQSSLCYPSWDAYH